MERRRGDIVRCRQHVTIVVRTDCHLTISPLKSISPCSIYLKSISGLLCIHLDKNKNNNKCLICMGGGKGGQLPPPCPGLAPPAAPVIVHAFIKSPSLANFCPHVPCPMPPGEKVWRRPCSYEDEMNDEYNERLCTSDEVIQ